MSAVSSGATECRSVYDKSRLQCVVRWTLSVVATGLSVVKGR